MFKLNHITTHLKLRTRDWLSHQRNKTGCSDYSMRHVESAINDVIGISNLSFYSIRVNKEQWAFPAGPHKICKMVYILLCLSVLYQWTK
jgi:hypothetical protein